MQHEPLFRAIDKLLKAAGASVEAYAEHAGIRRNSQAKQPEGDSRARARNCPPTESKRKRVGLRDWYAGLMVNLTAETLPPQLAEIVEAEKARIPMCQGFDSSELYRVWRGWNLLLGRAEIEFAAFVGWIRKAPPFIRPLIFKARKEGWPPEPADATVPLERRRGSVRPKQSVSWTEAGARCRSPLPSKAWNGLLERYGVDGLERLVAELAGKGLDVEAELATLWRRLAAGGTGWRTAPTS